MQQQIRLVIAVLCHRVAVTARSDLVPCILARDFTPSCTLHPQKCLFRHHRPKRRQVEVVWVEGNHDHGLSQVMSHLVGIRVYQEFTWEFAGVRHLAIHGHQFDQFVSGNRLVSGFLSALHLAMQKMSFGKKRLTGFIERFDTVWLRLSAKVAAGALAHARAQNAQRVFCGHTHEALSLERDGVEYYNTGSWTQDSATYIAVDQSGVRVWEYRDPPDDSLEHEVKEELELDFEDLLTE